MNIINSNIISAEYDVFWQDISAIVGNMQPRPILVITNKMGEGTTGHAQLQKMLDVSKLTADQYNIISLEDNQKVAWHHLRNALNPGFVFLIGVAPSMLGVSALFKINEPNRFNDTIWLPTVSIAELEQRQDVKKHLWGAGMKPVFVDKLYGELSLGALI